jgi:4,5-dihydroxyphthalate decarboxylase
MSRLGALRTVMATSPLTEPLKSGAVVSPGLTFDFVDVSPVHKAFAPMVREQSYDLSELAIVTALQAVAHGRPIILLPAVLAARFQRGCLVTRRSGGVTRPQELRGKRIGVRAYTQTTGMWVRAHLAEDYGLATASMHWLTRDPAHVEQYQDPSFVEHAIDQKSLVDQLREGVIDAAIFGNDLPRDEEFVPVIADAGAKDRAWYDQHGFVPINHLASASTAACERDPGAVRAAYGLLLHSFAQLHAPAGEPTAYAFGFDKLRGPVQYVIDACLEQGLLPRPLGIDEVFGPAEKLLGGFLA